MNRHLGGFASILMMFVLCSSVAADAGESAKTTRVYSLKHAPGEQVAQLLQSLYIVVDQQNAYARFQFDGRTDSLIVAASEPHHKEVAAILSMIDSPDKALANAANPVEAEQRIRGYPIKHTDGDSAASVLRSLFLVVNHRVAYARFAFDPHTRSLVVVASETHHKQIAQVLKLLDTKAESVAQVVDDDKAKQTIRVHPVKHIEGEKLVAVLRELFVVVNHRMAPVRFAFAPRTHSLIVIADEACHAEVRKIVAVIDQPPER